jgi:lipid II:glycine glycyltransferase (peptidoglycan interpeptide bridge formation enzyme)
VENGYRFYDFGGYSGEDGDSGINRFKLGFGGRIETVSDNYLYSLHPVVTFMANVLDRLRNRSRS